MARIDWIEQKMQNWVRWKVSQGSGRLGYSSVNLQNAEMPREPYADAPIPTSDIDASEIDEAIGKLPSELKAAVHVVYLSNMTMREKLRRLAIAETTMQTRIGQAHRMLADHFIAKQDRQRVERARVEALQRSMRSA
jgi:DNA-directed RNA polymerase specialized sigma24 family protein